MPNQLSEQLSPYLQQHAKHPVDWLPWGEQAFALAREQDKPILLSIGYSSCHWCHVMAYESFEDVEVAAVMNSLYVNIKVDREERPDIDLIYQSAHQILQQNAGGWPLTCFLTPAGVPFYSGTYFPKTPRLGLPGFKELLESVATYWAKQREEIEKQNLSLVESLQKMTPPPPEAQVAFEVAPVARAIALLDKECDRECGGFGNAPKFPRVADLSLLLHSHLPEQRKMALFSLSKMADSGLHDHLGGGFFRYCVDKQWCIPHFEKMLYDNGPLLSLYAEASVLTGDAGHREVATAIAVWALDEMRAPDGAFYTSIDAGGPGEEGRYYVWRRNEIEKILGAREYAVVSRHWGLNLPGNFASHLWHLQVIRPLSEVARSLSYALEDVTRLIGTAKLKLNDARKRRTRPARDDKILVSWNALMIKGLLHAGRLINQPEWIDAGRKALDFIRTKLWTPPLDTGSPGQLKASGLHANGEFKEQNTAATLDDYAFLLAACLESLQAGGFRPRDYRFALDLAETLLLRFEDTQNGGFYFTEHEHEQLIHRPMVGHDAALPSGNGIAALSLQRLSVLSGLPHYAGAAERTLLRFYPALLVNPGFFSSMLAMLEEWLHPARTVVLTGPDDEARQWQAALSATAVPDTQIYITPTYMPDDITCPALLHKKSTAKVNAWICEGRQCLPPVRSLESAIDLISRWPAALSDGEKTA